MGTAAVTAVGGDGSGSSGYEPAVVAGAAAVVWRLRPSVCPVCPVSSRPGEGRRREETVFRDVESLGLLEAARPVAHSALALLVWFAVSASCYRQLGVDRRRLPSPGPRAL